MQVKPSLHRWFAAKAGSWLGQLPNLPTLLKLPCRASNDARLWIQILLFCCSVANRFICRAWQDAKLKHIKMKERLDLLLSAKLVQVLHEKRSYMPQWKRDNQNKPALFSWCGVKEISSLCRRSQVTSRVNTRLKEKPVCYMQIIKASKGVFSILGLGFVVLDLVWCFLTD